MSMEKQQLDHNRTFYLTVLNVLSCFSVLMLHCNDVFWHDPTGSLWISANFIETAFYFAVPVFFMVSGCTLMDYGKRYSTAVYFKKRFWKTVFPFLAWSLLTCVNQMRLALRDGGIVDLNPVHIIDGILNNKYMEIYWFFIPLFAIYLSIPILTGIQDKLKAFSYASVLGLLLTSTMPLLAKLFSVPYNTDLTPGIVSGYLFLAMLGYVLANREFKKTERISIYVLGLIGWAMHFFGTDWLSVPGNLDTTFKGYLNLPSVLQACGVFLFVKYHIPSSEMFKKVITWLSGRTLGIYLIHFYTIILVTKVLRADTASLWWRTIGTVIVFVVSAGIVWVMQKMPLVKKIVP